MLDIQEYQRDLLNKESSQSCIVSKRNLSAPGFDKLTKPIFKYCPEQSTEIFQIILETMINTDKCQEYWKEDQTIILPKPIACEDLRKNLKIGGLLP
jgi:hypothetical protein